MALKSRNHFCPGGFLFFQPETNWRAPEYLSFSDTVNAIVAHRQANARFNLATDRAAVENELDVYNSARLKAMKGGEAYITSDTAPAPFHFPPRRRSQGGAVAAVKRVVAGASLLVDWLGEGGEAIEVPIAHHRAAICAGCSYNQEPNAGQSLLGAIAEGFKLLIDAKNEMELSTPRDADLKTCQICDCKLSLKVWAPLHHVKARTRPEVFEKLPPHCWIKIELSA